MKDSSNARQSGFRAGLRTAGRWTVRSVPMVVVLALVAALGPTVNGRPEDTRPPLTFTEEAQLGAEGRASGLAAAAALLAGSVDGELSGQFAASSALLKQQADALAHPGLSPTVSTPAPRKPASTASPSPAAAEPAPPPTAAGFLSELAASAQENLDDAVRAESGIARLLASVGAGQRHQVVALAGLQDVPVPPLQLPAGGAPVVVDGGAPGSVTAPLPNCAKDARQNNPAAEGLTAAVGAGYRSAYAYEVAAARAPDPAAVAELSERSDQHATVARTGGQLLRTLCAGLPPQIPAFDLDPVFLTDAPAALADLESDLVGMYAELVAQSHGAVRLWAVDQFSAGAERLHAATGRLEAFPGIDERETP